MLDFMKLTDDLYVAYRGGVSLNDVPLYKDELLEFINKLELSDAELQTVEVFFA